MIMNDDVRVLVKVAGENTSSVNGHVFLMKFLKIEAAGQAAVR